MKIYLNRVENGVPVIYDWYFAGKLIPVNAWVVMENV